MKRLQISFKCANGKPYSLSIQNPKAGINEAEVKSALSDILAKELLVNKDNSVVKTLIGAKTIETQTETIF